MAETKTRINIQRTKQTLDRSVPAEIRAKGKKILKEQLSSEFSEEQLNVLENSINGETNNVLRTQNLLEINMNDLRVQRIYDQLLRKLCLHLSTLSPIENDHLLKFVKDGKVELGSVIKMNPIFMYPKGWSKQYENQIVEAQQVAEGNTNVAVSKLIKCGKCGSPVSYEEKQNRSADEAADVFAKCLKCHHTFKV